MNGGMVLGGTVVVAFVVWGSEMLCGDLSSSFFVETSGALEYGSYSGSIKMLGIFLS